MHAARWVPDRQVNGVLADSWGDLSLSLRLPAVDIDLSGLSAVQRNALLESYAHFSSGSRESNEDSIHCNVYRLAHVPELSSEELTLEGQYAPIISQLNDSDGFYVTGVNFKASLATDGSGLSTLGVVNEHELAQAIVIENYLRIISAHKVLQHKGVVLHSAGLVIDGQAYIFSGRSNAGKTTLTRKAYKAGARVLSDDINLVLPSKDKKGDSGYDAYAVPFSGEFGRTLDHAGGKESYPIAGIVLLEQSDCLQTYPVTQSAAVARLLTGCPFVNTDEYESEALFDSVTGLVSKVPVIRLLSRKDDDIDDIMNAVKKQFAELEG